MIVTAGLSPAWQQILVFDHLVPGEVNRAARSLACASGKVLNVARALHTLGASCRCISPAGGNTGQALREDFRNAGIPATWIETQSGTRVCTTVIDSSTGTVTELVENAGAMREEELNSFTVAARAAAEEAEAVVLTGSLPQGTPAGILAELLASFSCPAVLDIRGPELRAALPHRPLLVKPNREELGRTIGQDLTGANEEELFAAMSELNAAGAQWVAISQGGGAVLICGASLPETTPQRFRCIPPSVAELVNPIGCGDSLAAGIALAVTRGATVPEAVRTGVAAAVVNLGSLAPAVLDPQQVTRGEQSVLLERI